MLYSNKIYKMSQSNPINLHEIEFELTECPEIIEIIEIIEINIIQNTKDFKI